MLQQLLRLDAEATALDTKIEAAVAKMEAAATAEGDRPMFTKIYDNLVADKRHLNARRAVLEAQLAGTSKHLCADLSRIGACMYPGGRADLEWVCGAWSVSVNIHMCSIAGEFRHMLTVPQHEKST